MLNFFSTIAICINFSIVAVWESFSHVKRKKSEWCERFSYVKRKKNETCEKLSHVKKKSD